MQEQESKTKKKEVYTKEELEELVNKFYDIVLKNQAVRETFVPYILSNLTQEHVDNMAEIVAIYNLHKVAKELKSQTH